MNVKVKLEVASTPTTQQVINGLSRKRKRLVDFSLFHRQVAVLLDRWTQKNFKTEGGLLKEGKWTPFKLGGRWIRGTESRPGYLDASAKLLQDTGNLRIKHIAFDSKTDAGIGTNVPYAKYHNEGKGALPVRRTVPKDAEVREQILRLLNHHARTA